MIDSKEGIWNSGRDEFPNQGYKPRHKEAYFPVPPMDKFQDIRTEMMLTLQDLGIDMECQHHEVATAGQAEIDMRFKPLLQMGDQMVWFKYVLKNIAYRHGHTVTFMPKPLFEDNGSGMHTHVSIWKDGNPLFAGDKYAGVSQEALYAVGGILKHCKALCAFTNPTTNSYKRLVPGFEAPVNLAYSSRNRSAAIRIPMYSSSPKAKRIEFRTPDPSCNGYLAFSAVAMAVIDGIENKIDPGDPLDKNIYDLPPEELLCYLCIHGTKHRWLILDHVCCVSELVRSRQDLDWDHALDFARKKHCTNVLLLGLCLSRNLLGADLPGHIALQIDGEKHIPALAQTVSDTMFSNYMETMKTPEKFDPLLFAVKDGFPDKIQYCMKVLFIPSKEDLRVFPLPESLSFLRYILRPLRLATEYKKRH